MLCHGKDVLTASAIVQFALRPTLTVEAAACSFGVLGAAMWHNTTVLAVMTIYRHKTIVLAVITNHKLQPAIPSESLQNIQLSSKFTMC